ncbi:TIGR04500 family putative peptide maturation system protein [Nannocystis sp. ILAH1]|uniref:TIGR04500 family putative peptide maturation system protein n=1 Tax=unclassified Nannocystis TaxID=2627009 RepID=UPI00226EC0FF|nr:TIGR04500 family putative peptide maturation system protein [Nannocystis sp. ILAH1]MCY1066375.1 TIGR04500 family putative peptide maturation system protein [Nannocystis sp. RBIL2]
MNSEISKTTIEILDEMVRLAGERLSPREGERRLRQVARDHRSVELDVLWEQEAMNGGVHYDALLRVPGQGTVSVGYCPDRGVPWALRGAFRWSENEMLRVNEKRMTIPDVVALLDFLWDTPYLTDRLVETALVAEALERDPAAFEPTREELQTAVDGFRKRRGLFTAEATMRWLEQHGTTVQSLEQLVDGFARATKLRDHVTAGREEAYFAEHRAEFDTAVIARIVVPGRERALSLCAGLRAGEVDLLDAATTVLRAPGRTDLPWQQPPPLLARVRRGDLPEQRAAAIFGSAPGAVLDPLDTSAGYEVLVVRALEPATFDPATRRAVRDRLFEAWLAERRAAAKIQWIWGQQP